MTVGDWAEAVDVRIPSPARMYDYYLGGSHNFAADREAADRAIAAAPNLCEIAQANRAFLRRAVLYLLSQGIRQFLDIGSGIPTVGNVHELVDGVRPPAAVVYVDTDPVAVAHSVALLAGNTHATAICADLRDPDAILAHDNTRHMLDASQPTGLLLLSMLQFVPDDEAYPAVARLVEWLAPGSYVAISHGAVEAMSTHATATLTEIYRRSTTHSTAIRDRARIQRFFAGLDLVDPGLVWLPQWRPEAVQDIGENPERVALLAGVARKGTAQVRRGG